MAKFRSFTLSTIKTSAWFPSTQANIVLYIAHLFSEGYASSTINTSISIIGYYHKLYAPTDPTNTFLVKKAILGVAKLRPSRDKRHPITRALLSKLVWATQGVSDNSYNQALLSAMYTLAFHGFLRISELAVARGNQHVLHLKNICFSSTSISISFNSFKHHHGQALSVTIPRSEHPCPVALLQSYLQLRPKGDGPLFVFKDSSPVPQTFFRTNLRSCLHLAGHSNATIKSHSFRIGAATEAARKGWSHDHIQRMGRWRSNAFHRYIRLSSLPLW